MKPKKPKKPQKPKKPEQCRIVGTKPKGLGAAMFPACVVFTFDVTEDGVDVSGFHAVADAGADENARAHAGAKIPTAAVKQALRAIRDEYGDRWTLEVTPAARGGRA